MGKKIGIILAVLFIGFRITLFIIRQNNSNSQSTNDNISLESYLEQKNEQEEMEKELQEIIDLMDGNEFITIDTL